MVAMFFVAHLDLCVFLVRFTELLVVFSLLHVCFQMYTQCSEMCIFPTSHIFCFVKKVYYTCILKRITYGCVLYLAFLVENGVR